MHQSLIQVAQPTNYTSNHPNHTLSPTPPTMGSPAAMMTLASDVVVLGAAVGVSAVGLKAIGSKYQNVLPAPIKSKLGLSKQDIPSENEAVL